MFPGNFKAIEGRVLNPGEKGLMVPTFAREELYDYSGGWLIPEGGALVKENMKKEALKNLSSISVSSSIVLMGMSSGINSTTDVKFGIKGIIRFNALNTIFGHFCIADIESYRECMGYFSTTENAMVVPKEEQKLLNMEGADLDSMFGSEPLIVGNARRAPAPEKSAPAVAVRPKVSAYIDAGVYNLVFIKLKNGVSYQDATSRLNKALSDGKTGVRAITWNKASGPIGSMALIIKGALFLFVTLLFVVAVIIIINTLTMAALERTSEIGMMRAIGARKSFIAGMFFGETGILSAVFGGAGIVVGIIAVKVIPLLRITSSNDFVQLLYGGDVFHPVLMLPDMIVTVLQLVLVTVIAAAYPVAVAKNITPLDAISRD
jgi:putative ABC transport system permease protein